jgi:hypothetical protein
LSKLKQLRLAYLAPREERQTQLLLLDGSGARDVDPKRNASHLMETRHDALFHFGFHDSLDDFASLIRGSVLKEGHLFYQSDGRDLDWGF